MHLQLLADIAVVFLVARLAGAIVHSVALLVGVPLHILEASLFEAVELLLRGRVVDSVVKLVFALSTFDEGLVSGLLLNIFWPLKAGWLGSAGLKMLRLESPIAQVLCL